MNVLKVFFLILFSIDSFAQRLETVIQKGHELAVLSVAVSADSNYVATGSKDKSAKLWEIATRREVRSFLGHEASVTALAFSSDGTLLLTGSNDKQIKIWEVESGKELFSRRTKDFITTVAIDPKNRFLIYAGYNNSGHGDTAIVLDFKTKDVLAKIPVNPDKGIGSGVNVVVSSDGEWVAFGEDNRRVLLYKVADWKLVMAFDYPEGFCGGCGSYVAFSNDSKSLFFATRNGTTKKYQLGDLNSPTTYAEKTDELVDLSLSSDGKVFALLSENEMKVLDVSNGKVISVLTAEEKGKFHQALFTTDNKYLIIASDDNTAILWDWKTNKKEKPFSGFLGISDRGGLNYDPNFYWQSHIAKYVRLKNNLLISSDGKSLIKGKFGTKVKRWDIATGKTIMEFSGHKKAVLSFDLSKDGKMLVTGGGDGKIIVWDVNTGDSLFVIKGYREPVFDVHFSNDETKILSSSWDGTMKIHELKTGAVSSFFSLENASAYNIRTLLSDLYTVTGRLDNSLQMWENDTRTVVRTFVGHTDIVSCIKITKDQKTLITSSWDGTLRFWDINSGLMSKKIVHSKVPAYVFVLSPDEKWIYSAGADRIIRIWDAATLRNVKNLEGHNAEVTGLLLSADSKMLISHSLDGVTKFWDLESGNEFFEHIHLGESEWLVKNKEGYFTGTDGARSYIHFVKGKKTYSVDQFFNEFYRPDLLPKIFQLRGGDERKGISGKLRNSVPPTIKIAAIPITNDKAEVLVRMINNGSGVNNLRILHNGKSIPLDAVGLSYPLREGEQATYKIEVNLIGGANTFTAIAANKDNIESDPRSVNIETEENVKKSNCYILAVGINEYKNSRLNLTYAKPDAASFSTVMQQFSSSLFEEIFVHTLFDQDATREKIFKKIDEVSSQISNDDVFIFYYAGHGSMVDNKFYFIPTENSRLYDANWLRREAIEAGTLTEKFKNILALKQLIIMDACQSGGSVEVLAERGANEEKAIAQLSRSSGIHVLAAAGSEQVATEFSELGHGLFTYVLIKALSGEADGAPKDGKVTIYEIKSYMDDQVPEMTRKLKGKPQYPYTFSRGHDFPVVIKR